MSPIIAPMPFTVGAARLSTAASPLPPLPTVKLYDVRGDDPAPFLAHDKLKGSGRIYRLDILAGQHSAITLEGSRGEPVSSNNHFNAVPGSPDVWIDHDPQAERRHIFFHGRRYALHPGPNNRSSPQVSLFQIGTGLDRPTVLQVRVFEPTIFQRQSVVTKLYGRSLALNDPDVGAYRMETSETIRGTRFADVVDKVILKDIAERGPLDHLVLNAHAKFYPKGEEDLRKCDITVHLGGGINRANISEWDRLEGKVRYIWFQNCVVGLDSTFCGKVAMRTGAIVIAYVTATPGTPRGLPDRTIDVLTKEMRTWEPAACKLSDNEGYPEIAATNRKTFWSEARYATEPNLARSLRFNMIKMIRV